MANPAINRVQGECGCGGARFLHQRSEIPRDFGPIKVPIPALFRRYQFYDVLCRIAKIMVVQTSSPVRSCQYWKYPVLGNNMEHLILIFSRPNLVLMDRLNYLHDRRKLHLVTSL